MKKLSLLLLAAASLLPAQIQVVNTTNYLDNSPQVAQWYFGAPAPHPGDLLIAFGSLNAGIALNPSVGGWQLSTCDLAGSAVNSNPATAGNEQLQVWHKVATSDTGPIAFTFKNGAYQAYASAVYMEISGEDQHIPIDYCYLAGHSETASSFSTPSAAAPNVGDLAIAIIGGYNDKAARPIAVSGYSFSSLASDENANEWSIHDSISNPSTDTTTAASATFNYASNVAGGIVTGIVWIKAAGTGGFGEQPGIAYATNSGTLGVFEGSTLSFSFNRTVSIAASGVGSWSCTSNCTSSIYTPPSSLAGGVMHNGVMVAPIDSIFAQNLTNFPIDSTHSSNWVAHEGTLEGSINGLIPTGGGGGWGELYIDNSMPTATHNWYYGCSGCNNTTPWPEPIATVRTRENGAFQHNDGYGQYDTHEVFLNYQSGNIYESYGNNAANGPGSQINSGALWNNNSLTPYLYPGGGSVAGMPYTPLILTRDDAVYGVTHPLEFAVPDFAAESDQQGWADYGYQWPASGNPSTGGDTHPDSVTGAIGSTEPPNGSLPPLGAWLRLSHSWCSANLANYSGVEHTILAGLCSYGEILTDWTGGGAFQGHMETGLQQDPAAIAGVNAANSLVVSLWGNATSRAADFEAVDVSSLSPCTSPTWATCNGQNVRVNPAAANLQTVPAYAAATVSDGGTDAAINFNISLLRVGVGTLHPFITVVAGTPAFPLPTFVVGTANTSVTWSKDTGLSTGTATISTSGLVTPASSVSTVTFDYFTGSLAADSNSQVHVLVKTIPSNTDGSIRIDSGSSTCVYTDTNGMNWVGDVCLGLRTQSPYLYTNNTWPGTTQDQHIWSTSMEPYGAGGDIDYGDFYVAPNSHWQVTLMSNPSRGAFGTSEKWVNQSDTVQVCSYCHYDFAGPTPVSANGSFGGWVNFGLLGSAPWMSNTDYRYTEPATVASDGWLDIRAFSSHGPIVGHEASIAGVIIKPDTTTTPHWAIDSREITQLTAGQTLSLSLVDWFTGAKSNVRYASSYVPSYSGDAAQDARWSITSQGCAGSSIGAQTGIYVAPLTAPPLTCVDTVQVSNGTYSATANLTVVGKATPVSLSQ